MKSDGDLVAHRDFESVANERANLGIGMVEGQETEGESKPPLVRSFGSKLLDHVVNRGVDLGRRGHRVELGSSARCTNEDLKHEVLRLTRR